MATSYVIAALLSSNTQQNSGEKCIYLILPTRIRTEGCGRGKPIRFYPYIIILFVPFSHCIKKILCLVRRKTNTRWKEEGRQANRNILSHLKAIQDEEKGSIADAWEYANVPMHLAQGAVCTLLCPHLLLLSSRFFVACRNEGWGVQFQWNIPYNERVSRTPLGFRDEARDAASNIVLKRSLVRSVNAVYCGSTFVPSDVSKFVHCERLIIPFCGKCSKRITRLAESIGKYPRTTQQRS